MKSKIAEKISLETPDNIKVEVKYLVNKMLNNMQPTIVKTSKQELCLVVGPEDVVKWEINPGTLVYSLVGYSEQGKITFIYSLPFPCELIGPLKDITEEQARELFDMWDSLSHLHSLVASTGLKGNVIILKRTN